MCPSKEPNFFAFDGIRPEYIGPIDEKLFNSTVVFDREIYQKMFSGSKGYRAIGESSLYIHFPRSAEVIARYVPGMRFIFVLRNPVERAYSLYSHMVRDGHETLSFQQALEVEPERVKKNWSPPYRYFRSGLIADSLAEFMRHFSADQLYIVSYEDFRNDNFSVLRSVCEFLEVDSSFRFFSVKTNVGGEPKSKAVHRLLYKTAGKQNILKRVLKPFLSEPRRIWMREQVDKIIGANLKKSTISIQDYDGLVDRYAQDIRKTEQLTGLDLSSWTRKRQA